MLLCSAFPTFSFPTTHSSAFGFLTVMRWVGRKDHWKKQIYLLGFLDSDCWFPLLWQVLYSLSDLLQLSPFSCPSVSEHILLRSTQSKRQPSFSDCVHSRWFLPGPQEILHIFAYSLPSNLVRLTSFFHSKGYPSSRGHMPFITALHYSPSAALGLQFCKHLAELSFLFWYLPL